MCWVTRVNDDFNDDFNDDDDDDDNNNNNDGDNDDNNNNDDEEEEEEMEEMEDEEIACRRGNKQTDTLPFDSVETTTDGKVCRSPPPTRR